MRRRGFSLAELMVVVTIAGVIVALSVPRLARLRDGAAVRGATNDLGAAFSAARHEAIKRRASVAVGIDTSAGVVELRSAGTRIFHRALGDIYGVAITSSRDSAVFDPRGVGFGLSNLTVTVRRGSMVDTLTMSRLGRVRW